MGEDLMTGGSPAGRAAVLVYHGLSTAPPVRTREGKYWVPADEFRNHISVIPGGKRRVLSLQEFWSGSGGSPGHNVVFTFDDGLRSDYEHAYPILAEAGMTATFFLNTAHVGLAGYLTWSEVRDMYAGGMAFQSHSHEHLYLTRLSRAELHRQLERSKRTLEDHLGSEVHFLAAPYGEIDGAVRECAVRVGYRALCSTVDWPARAGATVLPRICIAGATSLEQFERLASGRLAAYALRRIRAASLYIPKRLAIHVFGFNQSPLPQSR